MRKYYSGSNTFTDGNLPDLNCPRYVITYGYPIGSMERGKQQTGHKFIKHYDCNICFIYDIHIIVSLDLWIFHRNTCRVSAVTGIEITSSSYSAPAWNEPARRIPTQDALPMNEI